MFKDKVVMITGATGGMGNAICKVFARDGAKLVVQSTRQEKLDTLLSELKLPSKDVLGIVADVSKEPEVKNMVDEVVKRFGHIDVLVNNAGYEGNGAFIKDISSEEFIKVISINLFGVFYTTKYALPHMSSSGSIINMASEGSFGGGPGLSSYVSSKHAVLGFTKCAALEAIGSGVRVNGVAPGAVNTRMMRSIENTLAKGGDTSEIRTAMIGRIPQGRYAESAEVADLIYFLASDKADHIVGQVIRIDGGTGAT